MTKVRLTALVGIVLLLLTACGDNGSSNSGGGSGGAPTVSIAEPADGATVTVPFTVKVNSSVPLGTKESGKHHVHLFFDGNTSDYKVVESDTVQVDQAPSGTHKLNISLRNANHSAAGAETQITVTIGGSGGGGASPSTTGSGGGYGPGGGDGY